MDAVREAIDTLERVGALPDAAIDLAETALALAAFDCPGVDYAYYRSHLAALGLVRSRRYAQIHVFPDAQFLSQGSFLSSGPEPPERQRFESSL